MRAVEALVTVGAVLLVLTGCSGEAGAPGEEPAAAATTQPMSTTPLAGPDAVASGWPAEAPAEQGAQQWAVYLAVGPAGDPELTAAADYLRAHGYSVAPERPLRCDREAPEALGRDGSELAIAAYFEWRDEAGDFLTQLKPAGGDPAQSRGVVEMIRVTRDCVS